MSDATATSNQQNDPVNQPYQTMILRIVPDHEASCTRYLVKIMPDNTSQLFGSLTEALRHIKIVAQQ